MALERTLIDPAADVRVYTAGREWWWAASPPGTLVWTQQERMRRLVINDGEGSAPGICVVRVTHAPTDARIASGNLLTAVTDLRPDGTNDTVYAPLGLKWGDAIAVDFAETPASETATTRFLGWLISWEHDLGIPGGFTLTFVDARWLMSKIAVFGTWTWSDIGGGDSAWLEDSLPVFNPHGRPNLVIDGVDGESLSDTDAPTATQFTRGDIWNYLRQMHSTTVQTGAVDTSKWLTWTKAAAGGFGDELFDNGGSGESSVFAELSPGGKTLAQAIDLVVKKRSDLSWMLDHTRSTGKSSLRIIKTGYDVGYICTGQTAVTIKRGDIAQTPLTGAPEVIGGSIKLGVESTATQVRLLGDRKRFDVSFDTVSGSLTEAWSAADETAWIALYSADDEDPDVSRLYPDVFRKFVVPRTFDFETFLGWPITWRKVRRGEGYLETTAYDDSSKRVKMFVWRSTDSGSTWKPIYSSINVGLTTDGIGIIFTEGARQERCWLPDDDPDFYTWDGNTSSPTTYDFRITVSVEADERIEADDAMVPPDGFPTLQRLTIDDHYRYAARRSCYVHVDGSGNIVDQVTANDPALKGNGSDEVIQNDAAAMGEVLSKQLSQSGVPRASGRIKLKGTRYDLYVGDYVSELSGGGADGTRPAIYVNNVIAGMTFLCDGSRPETEVTISEL